MKLRYLNYLEDWPGKDGYRISFTPKGLCTSLICPWIIVTGESGKVYQFMRGYGIADPSLVLTFGGYVGNGVLDIQGDLLYSFRELPAAEPFHIRETPDEVLYGSAHHELSLADAAFRWKDADGRIDVHARPIGQPATFWIPQQDGMPHAMLSRSHLGLVAGSIDDDPVRGLWTHDHMYSTPGVPFMETEFVKRVHNYWMNWLVEYSDGSYEGGTAWRGKPGTGFAAAHHVVDGVSTARSDARISAEWTDRGSVSVLRLTLGSDVEIEFEQHGSFDWPIHTYGTVCSISREKQVVRSWNYTEHFPHNFGLVEDLQRYDAALRGRYPSLQGMMEGARVVDGRLVY
jgi:hypothetical protein